MPKPDTIQEKEKEALPVNQTLSHNKSHTATGISAKKKNELHTKEGEEWLKQVIQAADIGIFTWDIHTGHFSFSDRFANIYGYQHTASLTNKDLTNAIYVEDRAIADKAFERSLSTGIVFYEVRIVLPDTSQTIRWIRVNAKMAFDKKQAPVKLQGIVMDITEQKESEQRVRESEERLRLAAEAAQLGMWDLDLATGLTVTSSEHRKIFGYPKSEQWNRAKFMQLLHTDDREMVEHCYKECLITGRMAYEARIIKSDGTERWIRVNGTTMYDKKHTPVRVLGTVLDITDQKKAKEELENMVLERTKELLLSNQELEKSNHELEQFAYIASHDLQEPLRKIQTFADLVKDHLHDTVTAERYFSKINSSARRMSMLINDVLNYSRLTKTGEQFVETDLNRILKQVLYDFELLIEQKNAVITYNELPVIKGIPLQLSQLFSNLISNSLKFSEINPTISITSRILPMDEVEKHPRLHAGKTYVELVFKDNGIGFEQQYADQIFIIFQRLNNHKAYSGTGIGLALCKKIVEHHDGIITAQSNQGKGATFIILLPVKH